jgi:hypothetical protein
MYQNTCTLFKEKDIDKPSIFSKVALHADAEQNETKQVTSGKQFVINHSLHNRNIHIITTKT